MGENEELLREVTDALKEARESIDAWAGYAGDYFREKHGLAEELQALDALIARANAALDTGGKET